MKPLKTNREKAEERAHQVDLECLECDAHTYPEHICRKTGFCSILIKRITKAIQSAEHPLRERIRELREALDGLYRTIPVQQLLGTDHPNDCDCTMCTAHQALEETKEI